MALKFTGGSERSSDLPGSILRHLLNALDRIAPPHHGRDIELLRHLLKLSKSKRAVLGINR